MYSCLFLASAWICHCVLQQTRSLLSDVSAVSVIRLGDNITTVCDNMTNVTYQQLTFITQVVLCYLQAVPCTLLSERQTIYHSPIQFAQYSSFLSFSKFELSGNSYGHLSYVAK
jgi:hypothetical protein